jgi:hypothetical protein
MRQTKQNQIAEARSALKATQKVLFMLQRQRSSRLWFLRHAGCDGLISCEEWQDALEASGVPHRQQAKQMFHQILKVTSPDTPDGLQLDSGDDGPAPLPGLATLNLEASIRPLSQRLSHAPAQLIGRLAKIRTRPLKVGKRQGLEFRHLATFIERAGDLDVETNILHAAEDVSASEHQHDDRMYTPVPQHLRKELVHRVLSKLLIKGKLGPAEAFTVATPARGRQAQMIRNLFRTFDADGNGDLTYDEVKLVLGPASMAMNLTDDEVVAFCMEIDTTHRGSLRWQDMVKAAATAATPTSQPVEPQQRRERDIAHLEALAARDPVTAEAAWYGISPRAVARDREAARRVGLLLDGQASESRPTARRMQAPPRLIRGSTTGSAPAAGLGRFGGLPTQSEISHLHARGGFGAASWAAASRTNTSKARLVQHRCGGGTDAELDRFQAASRGVTAEAKIREADARVRDIVDGRDALRRKREIAKIQQSAKAKAKFLRSLCDEATEAIVVPEPGSGSGSCVFTSHYTDPRVPNASGLPVAVARARVFQDTRRGRRYPSATLVAESKHQD